MSSCNNYTGKRTLQNGNAQLIGHPLRSEALINGIPQFQTDVVPQDVLLSTDSNAYVRLSGATAIWADVNSSLRGIDSKTAPSMRKMQFSSKQDFFPGEGAREEDMNVLTLDYVSKHGSDLRSINSRYL